MPDFNLLADKLGVKFKDMDLLRQALTHRSYVNEHKKLGAHNHNERLEFLGDAVLELVDTDFLYRAYPDVTEGDLTLYRSSLVNTVALSEVANEIGLNEYLLLSRGEKKDNGRARENILANTVEAFIGALYLDGGYEKASEFIDRVIAPRIKKVLENGTWMDAKSKFQEKAQEVYAFTPRYDTISEEGPDHAKNFTVCVYVHDECVAKGTGASKQEAEQIAAMEALKEKKWI